MKRRQRLMDMYEAMLEALGPSRWWPGDTPFEVAVGAVLTQNTSWKNVEKAVANIKDKGLMSCDALLALPEAELAELIRPAGYYRLKAGRLRNLLALIEKEAGSDVAALANGDMESVRNKLLSVKGVGPETADSIMLYALDMPSFVVDAYTKRILGRHGLIHEDATYDELKEVFTDALDPDTALFNEYHALIVRTAHGWCRKTSPRCPECPLHRFLD